MNRWVLIAATLAAATGCITPRSVMLGQTANTVGAGNAEVALAMGGSFARMTPAGAGTSTNASSTLFTVPEFEGNVAFGLGEALDLNVHLSTAGIQPGVKLLLATGEWKLAILPEFAFLYAGSNSGSNASSRNIMLGLKGLASHTSGLYGGLGYDLRLFERGATSGAGASETMSHFANLAVGYELKMGTVSVRPELAVAFAPVFSLAENAEGIGTELIVLPNVTIAVGGRTKN